jgi:RNA polymerase sigma factor (TIGR02999 family)
MREARKLERRTMHEVTELLKALQGHPETAQQLLPLVYDELRRLARSKIEQEPSGHTLQATALVHEAYLRLVGPEDQAQWNSRWHFFGAAAEAMRRILVENARRKSRIKHGGELERARFCEDAIIAPEVDGDLLELNTALEEFEKTHPRKAELVKLRYFAGLTMPQAAEVLGIGLSTADRDWAYARAWLLRAMQGE